MKHSLTISLSALLLVACQATGDSIQATPHVDEAKRGEMLSALTSLEGTWQMDGAPEPMIFEFSVSSNGSVVREIMFPGAKDEMTNMYSLDGDHMRMTHYCAIGNQPHMRASALKDGRMEFKSIGVSDLRSMDQLYMGDMTLVLVDEDHIEEIWRSHEKGETNEMVMKLTRVDGR